MSVHPATEFELPPLVDREVVANGVRLHVVEAGPTSGAPVVLLHGFPEFWYGWRKQIGPLAAAGYRVLVPDQRGYNTSDKPPGIAAYNLDAVAGDCVGLIEALGYSQAAVIGHDWGAAAAWWAAARFPERVARLGILNVPHPAVMRQALRSSLRQLRKSWYMFVLQLPWLPEWMLARNRFRPLADSLVASSRPGTFLSDDLERYREAWSQPDALRAMVNWYRAAMRHPPARGVNPQIQVPTLIIWGAQDRFVGRELAAASLAKCDSGRLELIEEATHWVQHEEPHRVNRLLLEFLAESG